MDSEAAKVAFLKALNKVQGLLEPVTKDSTNPHFKSKYASLEAVNNSIMGPLTEAGFVLMSGGADIGGKPYLRLTLAHVGGHSESFDYPIVNDGNPQHIAASTTYARRYAICAMFNLSVEDDDGNAATGKPQVTEAVKQTFQKAPEATSKGAPLSTANMISSAQAKRFYAIAKSNNKSDDEIKAYMRENCGAERTEFIPRDKYEAACLWAGEKPAEVPF